MADFLLRKAQDVVVLNVRGRTRAQSFAVLKRLARKRGAGYLADFLLGRALRGRVLDPAAQPFPEMTAAARAALRTRCRHLDVDDPHAPETLRQVAALDPDYVLLLGAPVIRPDFFTLARRGTLNWHHGLAPRYRGSDCVLWAMANGEFDQVGFTIHRVSAVVDGGGVLLQRRVPVRTDADFGAAVADVARQGLAGFIEVVDRIVSGQEPVAQEQEPGGRHYPPIGWRAIRRAHGNYLRYAAR